MKLTRSVRNFLKTITVRRNILLIFIVFIGTFLRSYKLEENLIFQGELGHNYLEIKNLIENNKTPLIGPPTSHSWLHFGPLYYWLMMPFMNIFNFSPVAAGYLFAFFGSILLIVNFEVFAKLLNEKVAIISTLLIAISPAWLNLTRESRFFSLTALFFYFFFYFFILTLSQINNKKEIKKSYRNFFFTGLFLGIMFNFHWSSTALIPAIFLILLINKNHVNKRLIKSGLYGLLIPNLPLIFHAVFNRFEMLFKFIIWFPYRIAGFLGFYPKNNINIDIIHKNLSSIENYFSSQILPITNRGLSSIIVFFLLIYIVWKLKIELKQKNQNLILIALSLILIIFVLVLFVHGDPPSHYYVSIYPVAIMLASIFLGQLLGKKQYKIIGICLLIIIFLLDISTLMRNKWFSAYETYGKNNDLVSYSMQNEATDLIIQKAKSQRFTLRRVGPYDEFEDNYAQNYQYLLWFKGNEPINTSKLLFTIYEDKSKIPQFLRGKLYKLNGISILQEEIIRN